MFQLRTLGGLALEGSDGAVGGPPAQRHRLALLTLLVYRNGTPVPRDKLLGLLWPEHETGSARRLLNLAVHAIRQLLGRDAIRSVGDGLERDPAALESDAEAFTAALDAGDLRRAVDLYRGPFLDGFFLPAAPEFDRWADELRAELAGRYRKALEMLASGAEEQGDGRQAAEWWRRLWATDPGNGRIVRRLMLALESVGDRAAALSAARDHATYMAQEFSAEPDPKVIVLAESLRRRARPTPAAGVPAPQTLAVLPFVEASPLGEVTGIGEGIALELRQLIPRMADVRLAAVEPGFRGQGLSMSELGAALGVGSVLQGTVRRSGERVRVTAHLVDARHGFHLWSAAYDRPLGERFILEEQLAADIAQAVLSEMGGVNATGELDTRGLVLRGRFALGRRTAEAMQTALRYFTEATRRSPRDPAGFAGLADAYAVMGFYDYLAPDKAFGSARRAARAALQHDHRLAMPRATLAYVDLYHNWNLARAEARFQRAIAVEPRNSLIHQWYGNLLAAAGRRDEAVRMMSRACALDPQSLVASAATGWAYYLGGQPDRAAEHCLATLELDPCFALAHLWLGLALQELDRHDEALDAFRRAEGLLGGGPQVAAMLAGALAAGDRREEATARLENLVRRPGYLPSYDIGKAWLLAGRRDLALDWLERAGREGSHSMVFLRFDPQLATLRQEPRFIALEAASGPRN